MKERNKGITLIAIIITIIIMLILATVTIGATVNGGLFNYAGKTKTAGDDAKNREEIQSAYLMAAGKSKTHGVSISSMQQSLDKVFGQNYAEALEDGAGIVVKIGDKYYLIDENGKVGEGKTLGGIEYPGDITKGANGETYTGTESNPYRIKCIEDLVAFSTMIATVNSSTTKPYNGKYVELTCDLDFNSIFSYANYKSKYRYDSQNQAYIPDETAETTIKDLCTTGRGFIPIGRVNTTTGSCWWGNFDGKNHTIKNMFINTTGNAGLFGGVGNGIIKNITIEGNLTSTAGNAAAIVVKGAGCKIENCYNKAKIDGEWRTAGIICDGTVSSIINCGNEGSITAHNSANAIGISGIAATIKKSYNSGTVKAYGRTGNGNLK